MSAKKDVTPPHLRSVVKSGRLRTATFICAALPGLPIDPMAEKRRPSGGMRRGCSDFHGPCASCGSVCRYAGLPALFHHHTPVKKQCPFQRKA